MDRHKKLALNDPEYEGEPEGIPEPLPTKKRKK
jgi:hypothetical protein